MSLEQTSTLPAARPWQKLLWVLAPDDSGSDDSPVTVVTTPATEVVPEGPTTTAPTSAVSTTAPSG